MVFGVVAGFDVSVGVCVGGVGVGFVFGVGIGFGFGFLPGTESATFFFSDRPSSKMMRNLTPHSVDFMSTAYAFIAMADAMAIAPSCLSRLLMAGLSAAVAATPFATFARPVGILFKFLIPG